MTRIEFVLQLSDVPGVGKSLLIPEKLFPPELLDSKQNINMFSWIEIQYVKAWDLANNGLGTILTGKHLKQGKGPALALIAEKLLLTAKKALPELH